MTPKDHQGDLQERWKELERLKSLVEELREQEAKREGRIQSILENLGTVEEIRNLNWFEAVDQLLITRAFLEELVRE